MTRRSIISLIGLAGIADDETRRAKRWGRWFEAPMLLLALWIIIEWYLFAEGTYHDHLGIATNWVVWLFFVVETTLLCILVRDRRRYLLSNWINLLIIAVGVPLLWSSQPYAGALRGLRILLLLGILVEMSGTIRQMLARNNVGLTLLVALIIVVMAGTSIAVIDPAIDTPGDGIWWAWVTVTTVGYGDLVPKSAAGRVFGGMLMVLGLGLFSLITASFSAFLISREDEEIVQKEEMLIERGERIIETEQEVVGEERRAIAKLQRIEDRLEQLESVMNQLIDRLSEVAPPKSGGDSDEKSPQRDNPEKL